MAINDTAEYVWDFLKTHADAAAFRDLVIGSADNILEAGDLSIDILNEAVKTRRAAASTAEILAVSVQDAGEDPTSVARIWQQTVVVRLYDRGRGYRNIRTARLELMRILRAACGGITEGNRMGTLFLSYAGRGGSSWDKVFDVQYEGVLFRARVEYEEVD